MTEFMILAYDEAMKGILAGDGGPFGAAVVKEGKLIASGHNMVIVNKDSTAHAEIIAIRKAEQTLRTHDLSGCELYTTCHPCPMCLGAIMWARIIKVYYACTTEDAANAGFSDKHFYETFSLLENDGLIKLEHQENKECLALFDEWTKSKKHKMY